MIGKRVDFASRSVIIARIRPSARTELACASILSKFLNVSDWRDRPQRLRNWARAGAHNYPAARWVQVGQQHVALPRNPSCCLLSGFFRRPFRLQSAKSISKSPRISKGKRSRLRTPRSKRLNGLLRRAPTSGEVIVLREISFSLVAKAASLKTSLRIQSV